VIKRTLVRGVRKSAHRSRKALMLGANYSGRVENKAHRIINGTDDTIKLHDKVLFEKIYYDALPYITPIHPALPTADRKSRTSLLIPSLQKSSFFGGTATAIFLAGMVAEKTQTPLYVYETLKKGEEESSSIKKFLNDNSINFTQNIEVIDLSPRTYNQYGYIDLHPDDIYICSAWWDAYLLEKLPIVRKFIYMIQDYEPIFYNNSDMRVLAEGTYTSNRFVPVCNTELMYKFMSQKGYSYIKNEGLYFEPAVSLSNKIELKLKTSKLPKKMFIYGRPSVERNLFYTALKALDELFTEQQLNPQDWECYMAGQDGISNILLESGKEVVSMGKLSINEYYGFAKDIDLAISLMLAPHPSYPPLELSSLGAAVVTTSYETKKDLNAYNKNLVVGGSSVDEVKSSILKAVRINPEERYNNAKATNLPTDWESALTKTVDSAIKATLNKT
jgi:hypothetical protein